MSMIERQTLVRMHLVIATFIFPAAIMFPVTGALYTWEVKGSYITEGHDIPLSAPLQKDQDKLLGRVLRELQARDLSLPTGKPKIKSAGTSWYLEWTGSNMDVTLEPTARADIARLTIKTTTWYRHFVQLHKAKGGQLFKAYAALFAVILLTLLTSGFIMALQMPRHRKVAGLSAALGLLVFALVAGVS